MYYSGETEEGLAGVEPELKYARIFNSKEKAESFWPGDKNIVVLEYDSSTGETKLPQ